MAVVVPRSAYNETLFFPLGRPLGRGVLTLPGDGTAAGLLSASLFGACGLRAAVSVCGYIFVVCCCFVHVVIGFFLVENEKLMMLLLRDRSAKSKSRRVYFRRTQDYTNTYTYLIDTRCGLSITADICGIGCVNLTVYAYESKVMHDISS